MSQEEPVTTISASPYDSPLQAFCSSLKIENQPKRPEKPKVEYLHVRAKSQPEKVTRRSIVATPLSIQNRPVVSASTESLSKVQHPKAISPYGILHQRPERPQREPEVIKRFTKVYLSDKQSKNLKELGMEFPMAPPATPLPGKILRVIISQHIYQLLWQ